jgi:hypothetical protein
MENPSDDPEIEDSSIDDTDEDSQHSGVEGADQREGDRGGATAQPVTRSGWSARVWPNRSPAAVGAGRPGVSTKRAIERLDERERRLSLAAGGVALLLGVLIYLLETQDKVHFTKSPDAPVTTLILGIACGGLLLGATFVGRRAPVGFVALFAFLIFGTSAFALGLPFLALAAWLLYRSYKIQREAAAQLRAARSGDSTSRPPSRRAPGGPAKSSRATPKEGNKRGPAKPEANKRYTPKRPRPSAPKPSRRDRKAAKAAD